MDTKEDEPLTETKESESRAREPVGVPNEVESRVRHIMGMMRRLEWIRGASGESLADEWGLSLSRVEDYSAEASRRVKAEVTDPDHVTSTVCTALDTVLREAMADSRKCVMEPGGTDAYGETKYVEVDPNKARKIVIDASKVWADISGATAPKEVKVTGSVSLDEIDELRKKIRGSGNDSGTTGA